MCALNYADPLLRFSLFTLRADRRQLYRLTLGRTFGGQRTKRQTLSAASLFLSPTSLIAFAATFFVWFCLPCIPFDGWGGEGVSRERMQLLHCCNLLAFEWTFVVVVQNAAVAMHDLPAILLPLPLPPLPHAAAAAAPVAPACLVFRAIFRAAFVIFGGFFHPASPPAF